MTIRHGPPPSDVVEPVEQHTPWLRRVLARTVQSTDGVSIQYQVIPPARKDARTLVFANGLGGRLYSWEPLIERFAGECRLLTWDYRGLYGSGPCERRRDLAIWNHPDDARAVLDAEEVEGAVFVGWSMGVQVALEMATAFPDRVAGLVLLNGTHGHAFETAFQGLFRLPWLARYLHGAIDRLCRHDALVEAIRKVALSRFNAPLLGPFYGRLRGNQRIADAYRQYVNDVFGSSFKNYLRLFQELDAHSTYHHLPEIAKPALIISGGLDWLTPAYQSFEIARRMPAAEHCHFRLGTHFVLLEYPAQVTGKIAEFLESRVHWRRP